MKKFILIACFAFVGVSLGACSSTLDGAGRDISKAGEKISDTF
ncbi:MAG: entericidin A/B family lipoprotein [Alphaproteobacteria bacterium]